MVHKRLAVAVLAVSSALTLSAQPRSAAVAKDITVLGFKLHYLEAGRGAPVVLLHGLGGDGSRWGPNIEPLARDFHVFALDQIGFGQSDKPLANYHTGMLAEFLVVLADGGGYRSADTPPAAPTPEALRRRQLQNSVTREETREFFRILFHDKSLVTDRMVDEQLAMRLRSAFTITKIQEAGERGSLTEQQVRAVKAPTLVVWGKYDELANPAGADRLERAIPGARKVIIDNCGHMPQLERTDEFNKIVREFLLGGRSSNQ